MAELILGKDLMVFFRRVKDQKTQDAAKVRFQTEHTINAEKEVETTKTKDGVVNSISDGEVSGEFVSLAYREDGTTTEMWREMRKWFIAGDKVECWQVDLASNALLVAKMSMTLNITKAILKTLKSQHPLTTKLSFLTKWLSMATVLFQPTA